MIKGDYERLMDLAEYNVCAEHKTPLEVAWSSEEKSWFLRCGECETPEAVTRNPSLTEEYRQGTLEDGPVADNVKKGIERRTMTQDKQVIPFEIQGVPGHDLATGDLLTKGQMLALVDYARKYSLDPMRGHVCLMYGKPYITIDGYLYHANSQGIPFSLISHPMTPEELKTYKLEEADHGWIAEVVKTNTGARTMGVGVVIQGETTAMSKRDPTQLRSPVVAAHPWQLGQKRAEWQALRRAFPIGDSSVE